MQINNTLFVFSYLSHWNHSLLQLNVAQADRYISQGGFQRPYVIIASHKQSSYINYFTVIKSLTVFSKDTWTEAMSFSLGFPSALHKAWNTVSHQET